MFDLCTSITRLSIIPTIQSKTPLKVTNLILWSSIFHVQEPWVTLVQRHLVDEIYFMLFYIYMQYEEMFVCKRENIWFIMLWNALSLMPSNARFPLLYIFVCRTSLYFRKRSNLTRDLDPNGGSFHVLQPLGQVLSCLHGSRHGLGLN